MIGRIKRMHQEVETIHNHGVDHIHAGMLHRNIDEMGDKIERLTRLQDGQAAVNSDLRKENRRLRDIDDVLRDFNYEKQNAERAAFAREGFEEARATRQS